MLWAIMECQNRVRAMALVHEKRSPSENPPVINITDYIRYLGNYLFSFYRVNMNTHRPGIECGNIRVGINTALPPGVLINELISNRLTHAFPKGTAGEILIRRDTKDTEIEILVCDNGTRFPKDPDR